jgi:hypothetical protein
VSTGATGWSSVVGTTSGRPYTEVDEMWTSRGTPARRTASATLRVPSTITDRICAAG